MLLFLVVVVVAAVTAVWGVQLFPVVAAVADAVAVSLCFARPRLHKDVRTVASRSNQAKYVTDANRRERPYPTTPGGEWGG